MLVNLYEPFFAILFVQLLLLMGQGRFGSRVLAQPAQPTKRQKYDQCEPHQGDKCNKIKTHTYGLLPILGGAK
jgi:hypothetical protein